MNKLYITKKETEELFEKLKVAFTPWQVEEIRKRTPKSEIHVKKDESGNEYKTVSGSYIKNRLNFIFGWDWDFQIISKEYFSGANEVIVQGRLTIRSQALHPIIREQFGKHYLEVKSNKNRNVTRTSVINIGNGYKSASTDALKKCASEFGICWDIYTNETKEGDKTEDLKGLSHDEMEVYNRLDTHLKSFNSAEEIDQQFEQFENDQQLTKESKEVFEKLVHTHIERVINKEE